jgi:predicted nucleic acid-binding protein
LVVVDASVLVRAFGDDGLPGEIARRRLRGQRLVAPELFDIEVISAFRRKVSRQEMSVARAERGLARLADLPVRRISHRHLARRCWDLRDNLTPYDAAYVATAELFGETLLTADAALWRAPALNCEVELLADA